MKGLYRKVVSGKIPQLPLHYSADLNCLIKLMINVVPGSRPTCEKLLEMPIMLRNVYNQDEVEILAASNGLMETIRLPPTLRSLKTRLPAPNYTKKRNLSAKMRTDDIENYGKFVSNIDKSLNKIHLTPSPTLRTSSKPKVDNNIFKEQRVLQDINPNVVAARLPPMSKGTYHINRIF